MTAAHLAFAAFASWAAWSECSGLAAVSKGLLSVVFRVCAVCFCGLAGMWTFDLVIRWIPYASGRLT